MTPHMSHIADNDTTDTCLGYVRRSALDNKFFWSQPSSRSSSERARAAAQQERARAEEVGGVLLIQGLLSARAARMMCPGVFRVPPFGPLCEHSEHWSYFQIFPPLGRMRCRREIWSIHIWVLVVSRSSVP